VTICGRNPQSVRGGGLGLISKKDSMKEKKKRQPGILRKTGEPGGGGFVSLVRDSGRIYGSYYCKKSIDKKSATGGDEVLR